ncbi:MAG: ABC transporter permease subunit, partial [Planctomycetaceae bacterium]|nr:ABC transporter permease subunit [Planctomycetaceae bacterium]
GFIRLRQIPPIVVPSPWSVVRAAAGQAESIQAAALRTAAAAGTGLCGAVVIGLLTACVFSQSRLARAALYPYAILLQTIPIIAVAPIVVVTCGRGFHSVALIAMLISTFPVITSTTTGLLQVDAGLSELFALYGATRLQRLWKLQLPGSLPYLISGIRIAGGAAIVGAIVGEFFVGSHQPGLGTLIQLKSAGTRTDQLYAVVIAATLLGVSVFSVVTLVGEFVLRRWLGMSLSGLVRV